MKNRTSSTRAVTRSVPTEAQLQAERVDALDQLVAEAAAGDRRAIGVFAIAWLDILYRWAKEAVGSEHVKLADDVIQDLFFGLAEKRFDFERTHAGSGFAWVKNLVRDLAEKRRAAIAPEPPPAEETAPEDACTMSFERRPYSKRAVARGPAERSPVDDALDARVRAACDGDREAADAVARELLPLLLTEARAALGSHAQDAEDVVQDVFVAMLEGRVRIRARRGSAVESLVREVRARARRDARETRRRWGLEDDQG